MPPVLGLIVPCYNEEEVLQHTAEKLVAILSTLTDEGKVSVDSFVYFVDDGSTDATWTIISKLHEHNSKVKGLKLSRNFGHQNALLAGIISLKARVDCLISIDADLQQDETVIPAFVEKFLEGYDIVLGIRNSRQSDALTKKYTALTFYNLMNLMGVKIVKNHADYRLISKKVIDVVVQYREVNLFLRGIFAEIGFKIAYINFDTREREFGKTKYSARKMFRLALDGITSFSVIPLRVITFMGFLVFLFSIIMTLYVLSIVVFAESAVPGWASTVLPIYFIGGIQIMSIGVLGEYSGKIYKEVKDRPRFIKDVEYF